ncbi:MAG: 4Fe-4S binding protein [Proteobacteria bacterium]|nr:4Fe-4S binding protein [Pseudomonadota bacterium]
MEEHARDDSVSLGSRDDTAASSVYIISNDCISCGICEFMCPLDAIVETRRQLSILKRVCDGCGVCAPYCPVRAIVPKGAFKKRQAHNVAVELRRVLEGTD